MAKRGHEATAIDLNAATVSTVLCCSCGMPMPPNQTMRCAQCLKTEVSIIDGISRQVVLPHCRNCGRYNKPGWTKCELESRELLGICLKRIRGLTKDVRLVDASFIWTEEHSKRIRVKITVQKEVAASSVLQQSMVVEFQVMNQQCDDCKKSFTPHTFNAIVQVRQKVDHRRTFCYLEQVILKHEAHEKVVSLKENREGLDFHFAQRSHAQRFADFVASVVPCNTKNSKHLCSHDASSNIYNYKYTLLVEMCPVCADDMVAIPKGMSQALSGAAPLMLCFKISNAIRLLDPWTLRGYDIPAPEYWKRPVHSVMSRARLTEYVVLNIEMLPEIQEAGTPQKHSLGGRGKMALADIEVAKASDFGVNDNRFIVRSHLGLQLRPGNRALGYDVKAVNVSGIDSDAVDSTVADIILVKRLYKRRRGKRAWELRRLDKERDEGVIIPGDEDDMEAMQQDLEEDSELRRNVNMYRVAPQPDAAGEQAAKAAASVPVPDDDDDEDLEDDDQNPEVPLAELLEGLEIS
eukprot:TRINITY_DN103272_c0_g1_i1.p1 TRINITY_DN103272_c0_g1~~TRINITY_DN103272_c0_g1_i1.p1  ORF type:complete len:520 (-),score=108.18 TRINITY_DN103272_c0_g1_i1:108-1667(-)